MRRSTPAGSSGPSPGTSTGERSGRPGELPRQAPADGRGADGRPADDLGFGTRVRTGPGERLLHRDGSFGVKRLGLPLRAAISLYHTLLLMRWTPFLLLLALVYLGLNAAFALGYLALGDGALAGPDPSVASPEPGFERAFFFSVQTLSTIGYGHIVPSSLGANLLATLEAFVGVISLALVAGLAFARFSRPWADILFSRRAIITPYRGITSFQFRIANQRRNQIVEPHVRVFLSMVEQRGADVRRTFEELPLERERLAFFPLSWTVVHPIDERSPLHGKTEQDLVAARAEFLITLNGIDETFSQLVHARSSYTADELAWNRRFADIYERTPTGAPRAMDLARIHDLE